ncbi:MAG: type III secretion HpaP family protein [Candidatus Oxydemutatoraceae bacterium WSBS_2016_MAG_OTU14]
MTEISKPNPSSVNKTQAQESSREVGAEKNVVEQSVAQVQATAKKRQFESRLKNSPSKNSSENHATKLNKQIKTALKVVGGRMQEVPNKRKLPSDQQPSQNPTVAQVQATTKKRQFESRLNDSPSKNSSEHHATKSNKQIKTALKVVGGRTQELPDKRKLPSDQQPSQNPTVAQVQATTKKRQFESRLNDSPSKNSNEHHATKSNKQIKTTLKVVEGRIQELPDKRKLPSDQPPSQNINAHEHNDQYIAQMQAESMKETQQATVQQPQDIKPVPQSLHKVVEEIANRVLISSQDAQNAEVRIQLKASVFGGSDIRIFREHGELKVMFVASSQEAQNQISQHVSKMESMLRERMPQEKIRVRVEGKDREGQSGQQTKQ